MWKHLSLALALACLLVSVQASAQGTAPFIYYSYEKIGVQDQQTYALLPKTAEATTGLPWADLQKVAFDVLHKAKGPTYGSTSIYVNPDRTVTIHLDESKRPYFPIIVGEAVYTFTELGATSVSFPVMASGPVTRDKVDTPAFAAILPLWRALPPQPLPEGLVRMPDGKLQSSDTIREWAQSKDARLLQYAAGFLNSADDRIVRAGIACLSNLGAPKLQDTMLSLLKHKNVEIRLIATNAMKGTKDPRILTQLSQLVRDEKDPRISSIAADILRASGNPKFATFGLFHQLNGTDPAAATAAAKTLAKLEDKRAVPELAKAARSPHASLRAAAVDAIAAIGDMNVLKDLLGFSDIAADTKLQAARALAAVQNPALALNGLVYLLLNGKGDDSANAATKLGATRSAQVVAWLIKALRHEESKTRRAAAAALGSIGDPRALAPLAEASALLPGDADFMSQQVIGIMAAQSLESTLQLSKSDNVNIRRLATESLGHHVRRNPKAAAKTLPILAERVADRAPETRAAAVTALGIMGGKPEALPLVLGAAKDPDPKVRAAAATALGSYSPPAGSEQLIKLIDDEEDVVRMKAIESCRVRKEEGAVLTLVNYRSHGNLDIKRLVIQTLAAINPPKLHKSLREVFSEAVFDQDPEVRLASVEGLKAINDPRVLDIMSVLLQDPDPQVKIATLTAYGETGFPQAVQPLVAALQDEPLADVKIAALEGLVALKAKEVMPTLEQLKTKEPDRKVEAKYDEVLRRLAAVRK